VLYSDLYDFRDFLRGVVNAGFSGLLWCPEVREAKTLDELVRRIQCVALSAQALVNAWYIRNPPWHNIDVAKNNEGVVMPEAAEATRLVRAAMELRMRLLPYLYTAFALYERDGTPPLRALVMDFPDDRAAWDIDDQFLLGDSLLVAPGLPGQRERTLYLPAGTWHDFHTGAKHAGGQKITVPAPLEYIPLFVRDGSVLPLAEPVQRVDASTVFKITPTVFASESAHGVLYEDDGETYAFEKGDAVWRELSWSKSNGGKITHDKKRDQTRYAMQPWRTV
jgi:alpha-D-xyloside xylohydrolase